jgi:hypothetical protein
MNNYKMEIILYKSKPLIIITFNDKTNLQIESSWKKKFKKIDEKTYHISTTVAERVFLKNKDILGEWKDAKFEDNGVETFYGFKKIKGTEIHSLELSKRFVNDWMQEYTKLMKYTVHRNDGELPITVECLYDAGIYSDGEVGNITMEEFNCLRKIINPDGEIIMRMKEK